MPGEDDPLVVRTPVTASSPCRSWALAVGRRCRTALAGSVVVRATSARDARTFDGWRASDEDGPHLVAGRGDVLAEQVDGGADEAPEQQAQRHEGRRERTGLREQDMDRGLTVGPVGLGGDVVGSTPMGGGLAMVDDRVRGDHDALAHAMGAPAEVEVVAEERQGRVEALEGLPDVAPDQHAR